MIAEQPISSWPLAVYFALVLVLAGGILVVSWLLGQRHNQPDTGKPYESGVPPVGSARLRLSAQFYLVAMFFVVFDLESVFLFAWAVSFRQAGWAGYVEMAIFVGVLAAALAYLWRMGALDWGDKGISREQREQHEPEWK